MKKFKFKIQGNEYAVQVLSFEDNVAEVEVNGSVFQVEVSQEIKVAKTPKLVRSAQPPTKVDSLKPAVGLNKVQSPLPGIIVHIKVKEGDAVKRGQVIMTMEAMKMENNILAEQDGVVTKIYTSEGKSVLQGDVLAEIG
ncbi:MAG: biotin/lipoyl-containing protein [Cyclobacteriaceae bacterium]|nr:biotin/lipoyl-containing protein [Cyclobacteriaceae bacterium]